jgi:hypothetical protein
MRSRTIWLLTALVVAGVCILPVWQGFELIRYALAGDQREIVRAWANVPGLGFVARQFTLTPTDDSSDDTTIRKRRDEVVDILTVRPLSSFFWLQLAESHVDAHEAPVSTSAALELSMLTGANEGYMMTQRGMFGIWQWEALSPESQKNAIANLVARRLSDKNAAWMQKTLAEKPEQVRQAVRLALQAEGLRKDEFARFGL